MNSPPSDVFLLIIDFSLPLDAPPRNNFNYIHVKQSMSWIANSRLVNHAWKDVIDGDDEHDDDKILWFHVAQALGLDPPKQLYAGGNYQDVCQNLLQAEKQKSDAIMQVREMTKTRGMVMCGMRMPPSPHPDHPHQYPEREYQFVKLSEDIKERIANNTKALHNFLNSVNFDVTTKNSASSQQWHNSALLRYRMFLYLKRTNPNVWLIPTVEIEFCWLSHIIRTEQYWDDLTSLGIDPSHSLTLQSYGEIASFSKAVDGTEKLWNDQFGPSYPYLYADTDTSRIIWKAVQKDVFKAPELSRSDPNRFFPRMGPPPITESSTSIAANLPNIHLTSEDIRADLTWFPELQTTFHILDRNSYDVMRGSCDRDELIKQQILPSYERFLNLCNDKHRQRQKATNSKNDDDDDNSSSYAPPIVLDLVWHAHQIDPMQYKQDCLNLFGHEFYHDPWPNGLGVVSKLSNEFECAWKKRYGTPIDEDWKFYNTLK